MVTTQAQGMLRLAYSLDEVAAALGISRNTAYRLAWQGVIPTIKLGERRRVVPADALERLLQTGVTQTRREA